MFKDIETIRIDKKKLEEEITNKLRLFESKYGVEVDGYVSHPISADSNTTTAATYGKPRVSFSMSVRF